MIKLSPNNLPNKIKFLVSPRDLFCKTIRLQPQALTALNQAASEVTKASNGRYQIILTRGHVHWGFYRQLKAFFAKPVFRFIFKTAKSDVDILFSSNGHDDGFSVDIQLYDIQFKQHIQFLSWKNIFISSAEANAIFNANRDLIAMCEQAMSVAGFKTHHDVREKLQMHYRLI